MSTAEANVPEEDWMEEAACKRLKPDIFFPSEEAESMMSERALYAFAKIVCSECPHETTCLEYAISHEVRHGCWGGKTPKERRRIVRRRRREGR